MDLQLRVSAAIGDLYELDTEIGRGGMAVVYGGRDVRLRRRVAIKVLPPDFAFRADVKSRFLREAQTAAQLNHPNIVPIYSVDERDGLVFFVMALVDGESLAARLVREPRPPIEDVRRILRDVAGALDFAHAHGVVHRDVKPGNVLLDREHGRVLVTDFGIARAADAESRLTVTGIAVGTPAYMSPEQALGEHEVDGRSDIYALGIVGYQMLAGELPFKANNTPAMLMKHLSETPRPLRDRRADVPVELAHAIERSLAKKADQRWTTAGEMRDAMDAGPVAGAQSREIPRAAPPPAALAIVPNGGRMPNPPPAPLFPPVPAVPALGTDLDHRPSRTEARRQVNEARREWREQVQTAHRSARDVPEERSARSDFEARRIEARIKSFRRQLWMGTGTVGFLAAINIATGVHEPWFLFPAGGIALSLWYRSGSLWGDGVGITEIFGDVRPEPPPPPGVPAVVYERVRAFRRRLELFGFWAGATAASFAVGAGFEADAMIPVVMVSVAASMGNFIAAGLNIRGLRRVGVRVRDALGDGWRTRFSAKKVAETSPRLSERVAPDVGRLAPPDVLSGTYGPTIRRAAADRESILEIVGKLGQTDKDLLPDVVPTVDALVERVSSIANALHRIDGNATPAALERLESRIASVEREAEGSPDRTRKLTLLQRQRTTIQDLVRRHELLLSQLESASLVLQNLKLDLVKLRSSGVQASIDDVTSATQEARALSREIGHVLDAAAQIRAL